MEGYDFFEVIVFVFVVFFDSMWMLISDMDLFFGRFFYFFFSQSCLDFILYYVEGFGSFSWKYILVKCVGLIVNFLSFFYFYYICIQDSSQLFEFYLIFQRWKGFFGEFF